MATISEQIVSNTNYSQMLAAAKDKAEGKTASSKMDSQAFLKLLTEQLKYQDPMNPMDNSEMLAQEAQFATLEQMEALTSSFSTFSNVYQANSLLGQCVRVEVDGRGYVGMVEGVDFSDSKGASVFVGDKYYPLSSITNVYYLSQGNTPPAEGTNPEGEGNEGEESGGTEASDTTKPENGQTGETSSPVENSLETLSSNVSKSIYEYVKQAINNIKKGQ